MSNEKSKANKVKLLIEGKGRLKIVVGGIYLEMSKCMDGRWILEAKAAERGVANANAREAEAEALAKG